MTAYAPRTRWRRCWLLVLTGALIPSGPVGAQSLPACNRDLDRTPLLRGDPALAFWADQPVNESASGSTLRFRMPGMMPGFLSDAPVPSGGEAPLPVGPGPAESAEAPAPNWINVVVRDDNPFFDLRQPHDPGGVGFYRLHSQLQLLESGTTSVCLNLQAVAPAGVASGGVPNGPTVLTPGLALFQELGGGTALQGFVGQHIWASGGGEPPGQWVQYGMGVQCPVLGLGGREQGLYLFVQALGRYQYEGERLSGHAASWEVVPGAHWRVNEKCWFSLGASRTSLLTCSWQF